MATAPVAAGPRAAPRFGRVPRVAVASAFTLLTLMVGYLGWSVHEYHRQEQAMCRFFQAVGDVPLVIVKTDFGKTIVTTAAQAASILGCADAVKP